MGIKLYLKYFSQKYLGPRILSRIQNTMIILILVLSMATFHLVYGRYIVPSDMLKGVSYYKKENFFYVLHTKVCLVGSQDSLVSGI